MAYYSLVKLIIGGSDNPPVEVIVAASEIMRVIGAEKAEAINRKAIQNLKKESK